MSRSRRTTLRDSVATAVLTVALLLVLREVLDVQDDVGWVLLTGLLLGVSSFFVDERRRRRRAYLDAD